MAANSDHHVPLSVFFNVFYALVGLTVLTVVTAKFVDVGFFNVVIAFAIASVKGALVMFYFMHLKWDDPKFRYIIFSSFGFVFLLFIFSIIDIFTRNPVELTF